MIIIIEPIIVDLALFLVRRVVALYLGSSSLLLRVIDLRKGQEQRILTLGIDNFNFNIVHLATMFWSDVGTLK